MAGDKFRERADHWRARAGVGPQHDRAMAQALADHYERLAAAVNGQAGADGGGDEPPGDGEREGA